MAKKTRKGMSRRVAPTPPKRSGARPLGADDPIREFEPFTVEVTPGTSNTAVQLTRDATPPVTQSVVAGVAKFPFPGGLAKGNYSFVARGVNAEGTSEPTAPKVLALLGTLPGTPTEIVIRFGVA